MRKSNACFAKVLKMTSTFIVELCHGLKVYVNQIIWDSIGFCNLRSQILCNSIGSYGMLRDSWGFFQIPCISNRCSNIQKDYQIFKATSVFDHLFHQHHNLSASLKFETLDHSHCICCESKRIRIIVSRKQLDLLQLDQAPSSPVQHTILWGLNGRMELSCIRLMQ